MKRLFTTPPFLTLKSLLSRDGMEQMPTLTDPVCAADLRAQMAAVKASSRPPALEHVSEEDETLVMPRSSKPSAIIAARRDFGPVDRFWSAARAGGATLFAVAVGVFAVSYVSQSTVHAKGLAYNAAAPVTAVINAPPETRVASSTRPVSAAQEPAPAKAPEALVAKAPEATLAKAPEVSRVTTATRPAAPVAAAAPVPVKAQPVAAAPAKAAPVVAAPKQPAPAPAPARNTDDFAAAERLAKLANSQLDHSLR